MTFCTFKFQHENLTMARFALWGYYKQFKEAKTWYHHFL